jgi:hypothetical protein
MIRPSVNSIAAASVAFLISGAASADTSLGLRTGTLGVGVEMAHAFTPLLGIRLGANGFKYSTSDSYQSIDYDAKLKLATGQLLFDWFPFANNFRISAGGMYNANKLTLNGKPSSSGTFTINGNTYSSANVDSLDGKIDFRKAAPYLGLGYGRPIGKGFSFSGDLGVLFQGAARSALNVTCSASTPAAACDQIRSDVAAEQSKLDDDTRKYRFYPVLSIGIAYTF